MILIKNVRLSYPALFEPSGMEGQEPKFNATFLFPKGSATEKQIRAEIERVAKEQWGDNAINVLKKQQGDANRRVIKDGDDKLTSEGEVAPGYTGMNYIKASNKTRVAIVDRNHSELIASDGKPYGGCYVNAQLDIWPQDNKFGKFINTKLLAVQFWEDGDAFGGGSRADISAFDFDDDDTGEETTEASGGW